MAEGDRSSLGEMRATISREIPSVNAMASSSSGVGDGVASGVGVAVGLGALGVAVIGTIVTLLVLALEGVIESRISAKPSKKR